MDTLNVFILPVLIIISSLIIACLLAPIFEKLFDKITYAFGNWLLKQFPTSGIVQRPHEEPKHKYSSIYIPQPIKKIIHNIFRQLKNINQTVKSVKQTKQSAKCYENPLDKQSLNTANNPILEFNKDPIKKPYHSPDSSIGENDESTKRELNRRLGDITTSGEF